MANQRYSLTFLFCGWTSTTTITKTTTTKSPIAKLLCVFFLLTLKYQPAWAFQHNNNNNNNSDNKPIMKAWTCHGKNQIDLVDRLRQAGIVTTPAVQRVLEKVDRCNYIPQYPYMDSPQSIGLGQTISAPHMHAHVLEEIYPYLVGKTNIKMLDVGCGSGYLTAALGRWLQDPPPSSSCILGSDVKTGKVFGIDVYKGLVDLTTTNIKKQDGDLFESGLLQVALRDGWKGWPEEAPFDAIHVGAAADGVPYELLKQLKVGGVMIIPMGPQAEVQTLYKIERIADTTTTTDDETSDAKKSFIPEDYQMTNLLGVRYVPLVHPDKHHHHEDL